MKAWMVGGDARSAWAARALERAGWSVAAFGVPGLPDAAELGTVFSDGGPAGRAEAAAPPEVVVLPFPSFAGERVRGGRALSAAALIEAIAPGTRVFGGRLGAWRAALAARGALVFDLYGAEPLTTANAVPTAEGAIALALDAAPITLHGARCLVIGFGRIGKVLAQRLAALSAQVTVSVRREADRGLAEALGLESEQTGRYPHGLARYDFVFNTVPAPVFTAEQLRQLSPACVLIDLSSAPYGIPPEACAAAGVTCRYAPGLPGKCAPKSAGLLYAQQILLELESEEPQ